MSYSGSEIGRDPPLGKFLPILALFLFALAQQHIHRTGTTVLRLRTVKRQHDFQFPQPVVDTALENGAALFLALLSPLP